MCITLFALIVLGAGVRIGDAGLACPDWPRCFGKFIPPFDLKVFLEWFHRVVAMGVGVLELAIAVIIFSKTRLRNSLGILVIISLLLFGVQALLGRQTVTELLRFDIVTSHLLGGYLLFGLNLLIFYRLRIHYERTDLSTKLRLSLHWLKWSFPGLTGLALFQTLLGGMVSSNYAGLACPDFPTCQGSWWPGLGGLIGIHFNHRLFAFGLLFLTVIVSFFAIQMKPTFWIRKLLGITCGLLAVQILWGIGMIFTSINPALALLHSATALGIFTCFLIGSIHVYYR